MRNGHFLAPCQFDRNQRSALLWPAEGFGRPRLRRTLALSAFSVNASYGLPRQPRTTGRSRRVEDHPTLIWRMLQRCAKKRSTTSPDWSASFANHLHRCGPLSCRCHHGAALPARHRGGSRSGLRCGNWQLPLPYLAFSIPQGRGQVVAFFCAREYAYLTVVACRRPQPSKPPAGWGNKPVPSISLFPGLQG
jgi:hypothetical protein